MSSPKRGPSVFVAKEMSSIGNMSRCRWGKSIDPLLGRHCLRHVSCKAMEHMFGCAMIANAQIQPTSYEHINIQVQHTQSPGQRPVSKKERHVSGQTHHNNLKP